MQAREPLELESQVVEDSLIQILGTECESSKKQCVLFTTATALRLQQSSTSGKLEMTWSMVISHTLAVSGIFLTANREENLILLACATVTRKEMVCGPGSLGRGLFWIITKGET